MGLQQLLEELLGLNSYIQVNKTMIQKFGLHEAILISELYSERQYWRQQGVLRDDKWFFSTRENLEYNTGLTPYYQREAISNLMNIGILECKLMDTPAKKYYAIVDDKLLKALTACDETVSQLDEKGFNDIIINNKKEINITNNQKSTGAGASAKHPRNFSKQTLTDDLQSGKDIDDQKKVKTRITKYEKCLAEIDKRDFSEYHKTLLREHLSWSFNSSDPNRNNDPKRYAKRLDELLQLKGDLTKIILQSRDKKWHCFYEVKEATAKSFSDHSDGIIAQTLSQEEAAELLAREAEEYGTI